MRTRLELREQDEEFRILTDAYAVFYEGLGVLLKEKYLDPRLIALTWGSASRIYYENVLSQIVPDLVEKYGVKRIYSESVYACKEIIKYMKEHPELDT